MSDNTTNNKRIAKNAMALYIRMIVTMLVGLYTSRVILHALGVEDYGIYNVVGGFVSMFSLISGSLNGSVSRFLTFELGRGDEAKLKRVFSTSIFVLLGLSFVVFIATETVGLWYLNNKMVLSQERSNAAFWVFQISVLTFIMSLINSPYSASIVSHERMGVYAYLSIADAVLKLIISFLVYYSPIDRLVFYASLLFLVSVFNQCIYVWFCKRYFPECRFSCIFDKSLFKGMFSFASWNFIGSSAAVLRTQGSSLLLNAFGGPVVNAANGIANTITHVVSGFVNNFTQAFNPQITKRYAAGEYNSLMNLLIYGSKYSYYLMFLMALPIMLNTHFILQIWLGIVPEYTVEFSRWTFVFLLAESISRPIITAKNATGRIRNYQIVVGGVLLLTLPLSFVALKLGATVTIVAFFNAFTATMAIFARMYMMRDDFPCWSSRVYFTKVFFNVLLVSVIAAPLPLLLNYIMPEGLLRFVLSTLLCLSCTTISILYIGCDRSERTMILTKLRGGIESIMKKVGIHDKD